jgi:hypothetical protein
VNRATVWNLGLKLGMGNSVEPKPNYPKRAEPRRKKNQQCLSKVINKWTKSLVRQIVRKDEHTTHSFIGLSRCFCVHNCKFVEVEILNQLRDPSMSSFSERNLYRDACVFGFAVNFETSTVHAFLAKVNSVNSS